MLIVLADAKGLRQAAQIIKNGGVAVYPTETSYAIGGLFDRPTVIGQILKIKQRTDRKFVLVAASQAQVKRFFAIPVAVKKIIAKHWPGPLSVVVSSKFSVRVPSSDVARRLSQLSGRPLIATSANISGQSPLYSATAIVKQFKNQKYQPDVVVDGGRLKKQKPSTLIAVVDGQVKILRQGAVKL